MQRFLTLAVLLAVLTVVIFLGLTTPPLFATMCTTTCSVSTLSCTPVNYCTSVPGQSINCDGTVTTCSAADAWCTCAVAHEEQCSEACPRGGVCYHFCIVTNCGSNPPHMDCNI